DLAVDKQGDPSGHNRISKSSSDWIVDNRGTGTTNPYDFTVLIRDVLFRLERKALTVNPQRLRVQGILNSPFSCNGGTTPPPPPSQVLLHQPADPSQQPATSLWETNTAFIANLKPKGGPTIHRSPFVADDVTAFKPFNEQGFEAGAWVFEEDSIQLASSATAGIRHYAVFGDNDWNHIQAGVELDPKGHVAGMAVGVLTASAGVTSAMLALIDEANGVLKVQNWKNGILEETQQTAIPANLIAPYHLDLIAYDDQLQVRLGDAVIVAERSANRSGQLAMVSQNGGSFKRLTVEALDGYRFYFQSSRFISFEQHIQSAGSRTMLIPSGAATESEAQIITDLFAATSAEMLQLMQPGADSALRLNLFQRWAEALSLPLVLQPQALSISRLQNDPATLLLLVESPEPLRFSEELELIIKKEIPPPPPLPGTVPFRALESSIPAELDAWEPVIKQAVPGMRAIDIQPARVVTVVRNSVLQNLPVTAFFALAAVNFGGQIKYYLLQLTFQPIDANLTMVKGQIRDEHNFNRFLQRPFIQAITGHLNTIGANQVFFLNKLGKLVKKLPLPDLPFPAFVPQSFTVLSNGDETRALLIPLTGNVPTTWTPGKYIFEFKISRERYPHETPDINADYVRETTLTVDW
ncbi:MAG TPA: hypothetical protein VJU78_17040, partial [Chitinophagaceae bacterium]|nr:hypothetical protein [Chitinophagaceae bacterium]